MNFGCKNSRYEIDISGSGCSEFVFLPVPVVKEFRDLILIAKAGEELEL